MENEIFSIVAHCPPYDHLVSLLPLQAIDAPPDSPSRVHLFVLFQKTDSLKMQTLFETILTCRLPGFRDPSDEQINSALDVLEEADPTGFSEEEGYEMCSLLDALTVGDDRTVGILMGRNWWRRWDLECDYCPKEWSEGPATRQRALLALRTFHQRRIGQQSLNPQSQLDTSDMEWSSDDDSE